MLHEKDHLVLGNLPIAIRVDQVRNLLKLFGREIRDAPKPCQRFFDEGLRLFFVKLARIVYVEFAPDVVDQLFEIYVLVGGQNRLIPFVDLCRDRVGRLATQTQLVFDRVIQLVEVPHHLIKGRHKLVLFCGSFRSIT